MLACRVGHNEGMIGAVVMAAGESRRMGRQKLLLPFGGTCVIERVVDEVMAAGVVGVVVVTGHDRKDVARVLGARPVMPVFNADYREGMLSSVRCGIRHAPADWAGYLVCLGDQPLVRRETVAAVVAEFASRPEGIVVPAYGGRRGHPIAIGAGYRDEVLRDFDDVGLRGLLQRHAGAVREVVVATETVLTDMDYPSDYRGALAALGEE